ncbi:uncharacterized protein LOC130498733 [Raphanus sativus]|uniref:Uncharacterized protein LOC130498733 n=1 Tax=Raphanus sativus TaxID=3726 RepID=A0A9W3C9M6_RAPSA|nr:uncharacterized protein LOC130498733 [Raphanus sativus]
MYTYEFWFWTIHVSLSLVGLTALPKIIITLANYCHHRLKERRNILEIKVRYMPSSTRSNRGNQLLFSEDPAHLERSIRKDLRSASIDRTALPSTDTHVQQSTDTQTAPSTDTVRRSASFDTSNRTLLREAWS